MIIVRMEKTEPLVETLAKVRRIEHPLLVVIEVKRLNNRSCSLASNLSGLLWKTS